jgi:hypothetical protein
VSIWERPLKTGQRGRPKAIDVSLFNTAQNAEVRLELGLYTKTKLRDDAKKLLNESGNPGLNGYTVARNLIALWDLREQKTTQADARAWMKRFASDAAVVSTNTMAVRPLVASTMDLFVADAQGARFTVVCLFEVANSSPALS